jgi:hypothetical protein
MSIPVIKPAVYRGVQIMIQSIQITGAFCGGFHKFRNATLYFATKLSIYIHY